MVKVKVEKVVDEAVGIRSFRLVPADGHTLQAYEPGAHVDVLGPTGVTRQYSLCSPPDDLSAYLIAVKREEASRGGSSALYDGVREGAELSIGSPRNLFSLSPEASAHLLFAAGIGITPLLSMAYALSRQGSPFHLHYFVRSREHAAFVSTLESARFQGKVTFHLGVEPDALEPALARCMADATPGTHAYTCGPAAFMDRVVAVGERSLGPDAVHLEHFKAVPVASEVPAGAFEAELARSGKVIVVAADVSLVDALQAAGCDIDTECREGICGTCVVPVLSGEPDHRDNCLSKKEKAANRLICACVSRARTARIVLDL
ncbi:PDR/VanB family oxidoreductase [Ralstonia soli]|uniref:PDR/VanB family oxidoreductase n=1 Tax=Ralstonia soli TaxID=2953896 RepID=A0ABT1AGU5_9RALS|nr:PDR/VanB family oxidoreductase [Ralstonia soli]MCO5397620.1 PDR/VanB family oxidoreductase [Ralstonia soli]